MMTPTGPKVLEYNARFGDPETQSMVLLLPDEALPEIILACVENRLGDVKLETLAGFACNVTVAAEGYPESYREGDLIRLGSTSEGESAPAGLCYSPSLTTFISRCSHLPRWN